MYGGNNMVDNKKDTQIDEDKSNNNPQNMECFVIMPISDPEGYQNGHFKRVYQDIFKPAINAAGFKAFRADDSKGTNLIQLEIIRKLIECPMAICDLSSRNPNVLFELGIRQAFDKPVVLVQECNTPRIFDISSIKTIDYRRERLYHEVLEDQKNIELAIKETWENKENDKSINSIVKLLSLAEPATLKSIEGLKDDPAMQYIISELSSLKFEISNLKVKGRTTNINEDTVIEAGKRKYEELKKEVDYMNCNGLVPDTYLLNEIFECKDKYTKHALLSNSEELNDLSLKFSSLHDKCLRHREEIYNK